MRALGEPCRCAQRVSGVRWRQRWGGRAGKLRVREPLAQEEVKRWAIRSERESDAQQFSEKPEAAWWPKFRCRGNDFVIVCPENGLTFGASDLDWFFNCRANFARRPRFFGSGAISWKRGCLQARSLGAPGDKLAGDPFLFFLHINRIGFRVQVWRAQVNPDAFSIRTAYSMQLWSPIAHSIWKFTAPEGLRKGSGETRSDRRGSESAQ